jgi:hypothetical protein
LDQPPLEFLSKEVTTRDPELVYASFSGKNEDPSFHRKSGMD